MRPVIRGDVPQKKVKDPQGGPDVLQDKHYREYANARGDLIDRIGHYCSYCEMIIPSSSHVEHVRPKSLNPKLTLEWSNFLLGCASCNSVKGDTPINLNDYFWPDIDNTFRAFDYAAGGQIHVNAAVLTPAQTQIAANTMALTNFIGRSVPGPTRSDRRRELRREAWEKAVLMAKRLPLEDTDFTRGLIVECAVSKGYFSVWMTVFAADTDMKLRLIDAFAFPGTAQDCFDANGNPIPRHGGQI